MNTFSGFPVAALDFYDNLEMMDNTRSFWESHRAICAESVRAPMTSLYVGLEPESGLAPSTVPPSPDEGRSIRDYGRMDLVEVVIDFQNVPSVDEVNDLVEALTPNLRGQTTFAPVGDNHPDVSFYDTTVEVSLVSRSFTADDAEPSDRGEIDVHDSARNVVARALAHLGYKADAARIVRISPSTGD